MTTPVSRKRGMSENEPATPGIFSRLFSSVKKRRTVEPSIASTRTTPLRPRRVHLTPPSMSSPAATDNDNTTVTENETKAPIPKTNGSSNLWESSATLGGPAVLNLNIFDPTQMQSRRRRTRFRPQSKTLLARRKKREDASKDWKSESIDALLEQNKSLFSEPTDDSASSFNTTTLRAVVNVSRKLGTNQHGSRFPPTKDLTQRVSFEEKASKKGVSFNEVAAQTPVNTNGPARVKRQQTPGFRPPPQPTTPAASVDSVMSPSSTTTTISTSAEPAADELKANLDGPFLFDGEDAAPAHGESNIVLDDTFVSWDTHTPVISENILFGSELPGRFRRQKSSVPTKDVAVDEGTSETEDGNLKKRSKPNTWGANMFAHSAGKWKCPACYVMNDESESACTACEEKRKDGGGANGSKPPASKETSSGKFPFGAPPASTPTPAKGSAFSFGSTPAPKAKALGTPFAFGTSTTNTPVTNSTAGGFSFGVTASTEKKKEETAKETSSAKSGFSFGAPPQNTQNGSGTDTKEPTSKPAFQFGSTSSNATEFPPPKMEAQTQSKKESEKKPGGFTFGAPTGNLPLPNADEAKKSEFNGFSFGIANSSKPPEAKPIASGEKAGKNEPFQPVAKPAKNVHFGDTSSSSASKGDESTRKKRRNDGNEEAPTVSTPAPAATLFGETSTTNDETKASTNTPSFSFGSSAPSSKSTASTGPAFAFGSTTPAATGATEDKKPVQTSGPAFKFGNSTPVTTTNKNKDKPAQTPAFTFGGTTPAAADNKDAKPAPTPTTVPFTFGGSATPATTEPSHAPFSSAATTAPGPITTFGAAPVAAPAPFGSTTTAPAATSSFGAKPVNAFGTAPAPAGTAPASGFGSTASQPFNSAPTPAPSGVPVFGSTTAPTPGPSGAPAFGSTTPGPTTFGSTPAPAGFGSTPGQTFGATPAPAPSTFGSSAPSTGFGAPSTTGPNNFGFNQAAPAQGIFGGAASTTQTPSTTTPAANGFGAPSFGATPTAPPANSFGATNMTTPNTPGGFNIGAGGSKRGRRIVRAKRPPGSARR